MSGAFMEFYKTLLDNLDFVFIQGDRYKMIFNGLKVSVEITFFAVIIGIIIGTIIALMKLSPVKFVRGIASLYVTIIRGTPVVVQLFIMYFIIMASYTGDRVVVAIIAFSINSGAYVSEMIRAGILAIDKGQTEAGRSLGLSAPKTLLLIVMPQAAKVALPSIFNEVIMLFKETSIVGMLGMMDMMKAADFIRSRTFNAVIPLFTVALIYLACVIALTYFFGKIEGRMRRSDQR